MSETRQQALLRQALTSIACLDHSIGRSEVKDYVLKWLDKMQVNSAVEVLAVIDELKESHIEWLDMMGSLHPEKDECVRFHKFIEDYDRLKMMLREMDLLDKDPVIFSEDGTREKLTENCINRMMDNFMNDGVVRDILRGGFKGYEEMSDVELIDDFLDGIPNDYRDCEWFVLPLTNEVEKAVQEKIAIMMKQIR